MTRPTKSAAGIMIALALCVCARAACAAGLIGGLYVATDPPGAAVYVNGEMRGVSPCGVPDVGVGEVEVKLEKQGYGRVIRTVEIEGGKTARLQIALQPLTEVGSIAVLVEPPGSAVTVDRVPAGRTPVVVLNVRAGTHRVEVAREGYRSMHSTVTVGTAQQFVVEGELAPTSADAGPLPGTVDLNALGELDEDEVPPLSELAEEQAFEPVRRLLSRRQYDAALRKLDEMERDPATAKYGRRIGRERRFTRRIADLLTQAYGELGKDEGEEYVLSLRGGIRLAGQLTEVTDEHATLRVKGEEKEIALSSISAEQVVRLASLSLDPSKPVNRVSFALLYAAEGEFESAYDELRRAAVAGYEIAAAVSYVDAEHLWEAAVHKDAVQRMQARAAGVAAGPRLVQSTEPIPVLVDAYRGRQLTPELEQMLTQSGFAPTALEGPFAREHAEEPGVILILDPGQGRPVPAYDRQEIQGMMDFVRRGGALVFIGAHRPPPRDEDAPVPHPFAPLLRWCGIVVRPDELSVSDEAPEEYPRQVAVAFPTTEGALTQDVPRVVFPIASPSLAAEQAAWVVLQTHGLVGSELAREAAPAMAAARTLGNGRVVVLANMPMLASSTWQGSPVYANAAGTFLRNALLWVSHQIRWRPRPAE
jgi:hypothetical protein